MAKSSGPQTTPPHKRTKSAEHHYFPKGLQRFWRDDEGWVWRIDAQGSIDRSKSGGFGHIRNAHHIKIGGKPSPWDETFEHFFDKADNNFPAVVSALQTVQKPDPRHNAPFSDRLEACWNLDRLRTMLAECIASLVVRSPGCRNLIRVGVQPFHDGAVPNHLISINQKHLLEAYSKAMGSRGKYVLLISEANEFLFGDGMLNNFRSGGPPSPYNPRCVVPILPNIAIAYDCPIRPSTVSANIMALSVSDTEVDEVNSYTMTYSGTHLFYRNGRPTIPDCFSICRHQQFQYHQVTWLENLYNAAASKRF